MATKAASSVPAIAPAVLAAYSRPPWAPSSPEGRIARSSTGMVPPMATAGRATSSTGKAHATIPARVSSHANGAAAWASATVAPSASTAIAHSSHR
ncbi:hypothetical protein D3C81_1880430 [compost metagenome]